MHSLYQINHIKFKNIYHENLHIIYYMYVLHKKQEAQPLLSNAEISLQFILCLKSFRVGAFLSELANLDHNNGPKYLMECLPYFTVLYLGRIASTIGSQLLNEGCSHGWQILATQP